MSKGLTTIRCGHRRLPMANLGTANILPKFRFRKNVAPLRVSDDLSDADRAGLLPDLDVPVLPYLLQDNYDRSRRPGRLAIICVENESLRATFYPTLGGRMTSLFDKRQRRELLFNNPVFQPCNLAIRNAWFSGGVEWNSPLHGHSLLTCSPLFAGFVQTKKGPILRLYEFDRALESTWQVNAFLPAADAKLWVHIKVTNPNSHDIDYYWWSNIAIPQLPGVRVLCPADYALSHKTGILAKIPFPNFEGFDGSYPHNYPYSNEVFFRKPGQKRLWIAYVDKNGRGLLHTSTRELPGRKMFVWGNTVGGNRWMDYLSAPGKGAYLEMQAGITPTQFQTRPLKAGESVEWTECYLPFAMEKQIAHHHDYAVACEDAERVLERCVPADELREVDHFLSAHTDTPIAKLLHHGSAWGMLHEKLTGKRLSPGLSFERELTEEEWPWAELLLAGTFSQQTLNETPCSWNVSPRWVALLKKSVNENGATWLHHLHLGVAALEAGEVEQARAHFEASVALKDNMVARRNLALLQEKDGRLADAHASYLRAWEISDRNVNLAVEIAEFLVRHKMTGEFESFFSALPCAVRKHERIQLAAARVALDKGDYGFVRRVLKKGFATIREGEVSLTNLWFAVHIKEAEHRRGRALSEQEKQQLIQQFPPPRRIDFRMRTRTVGKM